MPSAKNAKATPTYFRARSGALGAQARFWPMKQIYKVTFPTGKIYVGKDSIGSHRYFGSPDMDIVNADFMSLSEQLRRDYTVRKEILWESADCSEQELSAKEVEFIKFHKSNNPAIGYNRWPKFNGSTS